MMRSLLIIALAAAALAQSCNFVGDVTIPANTTQTISSCRYQNMLGQQRCLQPAGKFTFVLTGAQYLYNVFPKIVGPDGTCYTLPGCGNGDCPVCHAMEMFGCWNITSNDFTVSYEFNCRDANPCPAFFNYTMSNYCGDGICQATEFCITCPEDCCPSSSRAPQSSPSSSSIILASQPPSASRTAASLSASRSAQMSSQQSSASASPSASPAPTQNSGKNVQSNSATIAVSAAAVVAAVLANV